MIPLALNKTTTTTRLYSLKRETFQSVVLMSFHTCMPLCHFDVHVSPDFGLRVRREGFPKI